MARIYRAKYVLEVRDIYPLSITALTNVSMRHPYLRLLGMIEKMLYRRADLIVSPLQGIDEHVRKTIGKSRPSIWIPNSVNCDRVPEPGVARSAPKPFTFVYAGAHGLANDLQTLVEAAGLLIHEDFHFILYGDGVTKVKLIDLVNSQGLTNVVFRDPVPKTDIYDLLASADALMFLQTDNELYESGLSANKLYDYLAVARPVLIATNTSHNPIAAAGAGITVAPGSATAFADGARRMASLSAHDRSAMGARGRAHVREHYHLPTIASLLATSLQDLT